MDLKHNLRRTLLKRRLAIPHSRRRAASLDLLRTALPKLSGFTTILSFASKEEEINLGPLNQKLAEEGRLLLPKIDEGRIVPYLVTNLEEGLEQHPTFHVKEPNPRHCRVARSEEISCILVPGLGFDQKGYRMGYGLGHYDRFLKDLSCPALGIAFKEQLIKEGVPAEEHDIPVQEVWYF